MCNCGDGRCKTRTDTPALPFCYIQLHAQKPVLRAYPTELKSIGDHIRKRRLDLGLFQKDVAKILGANMASILNWEKNRTDPVIDYIPRIIEFLGYVPFESISDMSLGEKIITCRKIKGMSQEELARQLGFDPGTVENWENNRKEPTGLYLEALNAFLEPIVSSV